jgi:hypothetical protein
MIPRRLLDPGFAVATDDAPVVLALGDSFTAGHPVDRERDGYPAVLERLLAGRGVRATVLNAGMGDTGPDQHLRLFRTYVLPRLTPAVVVWSIYGNDVWDNVERAVYGIENGRLEPLDVAGSWIYLRQRLWEGLPLPHSLKQESRVVHLVLKATERLARFRVPDAYRYDPAGWGFEKLRHEIAAMNALAAERGFRVYYLLIPPQSLYLAAHEPERWSAHWSMREHRRLVALLRTEAGLIDAETAARLDVDAFAGADRDECELGARHFNERGYALLAEAVAARLARDVADWNPAAARDARTRDGRPSS